MHECRAHIADKTRTYKSFNNRWNLEEISILFSNTIHSAIGTWIVECFGMTVTRIHMPTALPQTTSLLDMAPIFRDSAAKCCITILNARHDSTGSAPYYFHRQQPFFLVQSNLVWSSKKFHHIHFLSVNIASSYCTY